MKRTMWAIAACIVLTACASEPASETMEPEAAAEPAAAPAADAAAAPGDPSGTWSGDWGPTPDHRNPVTVELAWDGESLTGTVNPGPDAIELANAAFDPETGEVTMEADAQNFRGETVHYTIQGRIDGNTMSGSWTHDDMEGDFAISMD